MSIYFLILSIAFFLFAFFVFRKLQNSSGSSRGREYNQIVLEIRSSKSVSDKIDIQDSPISAEGLFASLHGMLREDLDLQDVVSFEIVSDENGIKFYATIPEDSRTFIESQIYAHYKDARITLVEDYANRPIPENFATSSLTLAKSHIFPILTYKDFEVDPISAVTSALSEVRLGEGAWLQLLVSPTPDGWQKEGYEYVSLVRDGKPLQSESFISGIVSSITKEFGEFIKYFIVRSTGGEVPEPTPSKPGGSPIVRLSSGQDLELKSVENKMSKMGFKVQIRAVTYGETAVRAETLLRSLGASFRQFATAHLNSFKYKVSHVDKAGLEDYRQRNLIEEDSYIMNTEELASVFHLPSSHISTPSISWAGAKQAEPPPNLPTENALLLGRTKFRDREVQFGLANNDDRMRHMYLIGKSGTGKTTLFETMISQDIAAGHGVGVLDPHGELVERALQYIPDNRLDDVVIVDPSDTERPVGINLLEIQDPTQKNIMASALVNAIKAHFDYSWGPRLEYLLNYSILTLLEVPGTTMLSITRLLQDQNYQKYILHQVQDPVVLKFWNEEYKEFRGNQRMVTEAIAPIQNKVNRFLSSTTIRNILSQSKSTIDFWDVMNSGKILLMNLSKGKIGTDNANLLGALLVSRIQFMALQRAKLAREDRRPFYLYVDEFQNFATGSFESILSESRKYGLGLYLTHQYTSQLPKDLLSAVFGNVGTIATFSLGAPDAKVLENEFAPYFDQEDIISLERFHIYIKLMIEGMTSSPFSGKILLPWQEPVVPKTPNAEKTIELSRMKYGTDRVYVEERIKRWTERKFDKGLAIAMEHRHGAKNLDNENTDAKGDNE